MMLVHVPPFAHGDEAQLLMTLAQVVPLEEQFKIYRDMGVVLTSRGKGEAQARGFVDYLESPAGAAIFEKWGWTAH